MFSHDTNHTHYLYDPLSATWFINVQLLSNAVNKYTKDANSAMEVKQNCKIIYAIWMCLWGFASYYKIYASPSSSPWLWLFLFFFFDFWLEDVSEKICVKEWTRELELKTALSWVACARGSYTTYCTLMDLSSDLLSIVTCCAYASAWYA